MTYLLSLSTSSKKGSICLAKDEQILHQIAWSKKNSHAEFCTNAIATILDANDLSSKDIDYYICDIGPGSFTGVRVATSTIKSLAYANDKPIVPINSNDLLAQAVMDSKYKICSIINALRSEFYVAFYEMGKNKLKRRTKPQLMSISKLEKKLLQKHLLVGDGAELFLQLCSKTCAKKLVRPSHNYFDSPNAEFGIDYGLEKIKLNKTKDWKSLEPLYIRSSSAEEKLQLGDLEGAKRFTRRKNK